MKDLVFNICLTLQNEIKFPKDIVHLQKYSLNLECSFPIYNCPNEFMHVVKLTLNLFKKTYNKPVGFRSCFAAVFLVVDRVSILTTAPSLVSFLFTVSPTPAKDTVAEIKVDSSTSDFNFVQHFPSSHFSSSSFPFLYI